MTEFLKTRIATKKAVRAFFDEHGFVEVDTPTLVRYPGMEPNLNPIKTSVELAGEQQDAFLITSPEYHMKRLLAEGYEKIWQLTSSYRDGEERSALHSSEFKMIEWYMAGSDYADMASFTEEFLKFLVSKIHGEKHEYQECEIHTEEFFERITCEEAFQEYANLRLRDLYINKKQFIEDAGSEGFDVNEDQSTEDIFFTIFLQKVEPELGKYKPTFLFDYPAEMAALSIVKEDDPMWCERFELFISGVEIANAFSELVDMKEQEARLKKEQEERKELGKEVFEIDRRFIEALEYGIPKSSGIALGFDRLVMVLAGAESIEQVQFFSEFK